MMDGFVFRGGAGYYILWIQRSQGAADIDVERFSCEVERLLREYRQNQELVRNIGAHYYQIIYPVQLRHHEKMGISTREVNTPKKDVKEVARGELSSPLLVPFEFTALGLDFEM
ncbi:hypothetical protein SFRURICE_017683 [Spodoptera frugiperda]|nr:hypothetical protein SFRURICE_017683 [Spodoptera frugiperda]